MEKRRPKAGTVVMVALLLALTGVCVYLAPRTRDAYQEYRTESEATPTPTADNANMMAVTLDPNATPTPTMLILKLGTQVDEVKKLPRQMPLQHIQHPVDVLQQPVGKAPFFLQRLLQLHVLILEAFKLVLFCRSFHPILDRRNLLLKFGLVFSQNGIFLFQLHVFLLRRSAGHGRSLEFPDLLHRNALDSPCERFFWSDGIEVHPHPFCGLQRRRSTGERHDFPLQFRSLLLQVCQFLCGCRRLLLHGLGLPDRRPILRQIHVPPVAAERNDFKFVPLGDLRQSVLLPFHPSFPLGLFPAKPGKSLLLERLLHGYPRRQPTGLFRSYRHKVYMKMWCGLVHVQHHIEHPKVRVTRLKSLCKLRQCLGCPLTAL